MITCLPEGFTRCQRAAQHQLSPQSECWRDLIDVLPWMAQHAQLQYPAVHESPGPAAIT